MSEPSFTDILTQSGWGVAVLTAGWALILRVMFGRYNRSLKLADEREAHRDRMLSDICDRLSNIEGRFEERDSGRHRTRPGDAR
jgi:hypothetical protein